jgi:hypothetical protein
MHLARISTGVRELAPGVPYIFPVDPENVMRTAIDMTFTYVLSSNGDGEHDSAPDAPQPLETKTEA